MNEKKVREAIELMEERKKDMELLFGASPSIEKTDKTIIDLFDIAIEALEKQLPDTDPEFDDCQEVER